VPLATSVDGDQGHGTKKISFTGAVSGGPFTDGEVIEGGTSGGRAILDLTNSTVTSGGELVYFPIAGDANEDPMLKEEESSGGASSA